MSRKHEPHPDTQFEVRACVTLHVTVTIDALTGDEALEKFGAMDWADDGLSGAETVNYRALGQPIKVYP